MDTGFKQLAAQLCDLLSLQNSPLAITFTHRAPEEVEPFQAPMLSATMKVPTICFCHRPFRSPLLFYQSTRFVWKLHFWPRFR